MSESNTWNYLIVWNGIISFRSQYLKSFNWAQTFLALDCNTWNNCVQANELGLVSDITYKLFVYKLYTFNTYMYMCIKQIRH